MKNQMCHYLFSPEPEQSSIEVTIPVGNRSLGVTTPKAGAQATIETSDGGRNVSIDDMLTITVTINEGFIRGSVNGKIADRVITKTTGHEMMHAYDYSQKPLICLYTYIRDIILKNLEKNDENAKLIQTLQQQYKACVNAVEARAVMSEVATFLHYHVECRKNREIAYQILSPSEYVEINHDVKSFLDEETKLLMSSFGSTIDETEACALQRNEEFGQVFTESYFEDIYTDSMLLLTAHMEMGLLKGQAVIGETGTTYLEAFEQHFAGKAGLDITGVISSKLLSGEKINFSVGSQGYIVPGTLDGLLNDTKFENLYKEYEKTCKEIFKRANVTDKWWTHYKYPNIKVVIE